MNTHAPAVSIVCCARDGERHLAALRGCLDAALRDDHELVLVDDGSTDGTGAVFDRWAAELPRTTVLHLPGVGVAEAQVRAVAAATGERVWLIDCDDRFPADAVDALLAAARREDADVVVGRARSVDADGAAGRLLDARTGPVVLDRDEALRLLLAGDVEGYTWTKLLRRSLFDEAAHPDGFTPPVITTQADFCRVSTAVARSRTVTLIDAVVYDYVRHGSSTMDRPDPPLANLAVARDHLVRIARALLPDTPDRRARIGRFTAWFLATSAIQIPFYVRAGPASRREGRRLAGRAARAVRPLDVLRADRTLGVEVLLLRVSPRLYELVFALTHSPTAG